MENNNISDRPKSGLGLIIGAVIASFVWMSAAFVWLDWNKRNHYPLSMRAESWGSGALLAVLAVIVTVGVVGALRERRC